MSGFYRMDYMGTTGQAAGAVAIVNNKIAALDIGGGQIVGTYTEEGDHLVGEISISIQGGGPLITGQNLASGQSVKVPVKLPKSQLDGHVFMLPVGGQPVSVRLTKISDL